MFPSKTPSLYVLQLLGVLGLSLAVLLVTSNPLALLGLMFIPQFPLVPDTGKQELEPAVSQMGFLSGQEDED